MHLLIHASIEACIYGTMYLNLNLNLIYNLNFNVLKVKYGTVCHGGWVGCNVQILKRYRKERIRNVDM